jgi:hypothetical protein
MRIFISWSGERSKKVAEALKIFLEGVIPASQPWVSSQDTLAGSAWFGVLTKELGQSDFGLLCLTAGTAIAPWIAFEAGALSLKLGEERVCPFLLDVDTKHLRNLGLPYYLFNAVPSSKEGARKLVDSVLNLLPENEQLEGRRIEANFKAFWPDLSKAIKLAKKGKEPLSESERLLSAMEHQRAFMELQSAKMDAVVSLLKDRLKSQFGGMDQ